MTHASRLIHRQGQITTELAALLAFIVAALVMMVTYIQRGAQGGMKSNVDAIGQQFDPGGRGESLTRGTRVTDDNINYGGQCSDATYRVGSSAAVAPVDCTAPRAVGFDPLLVR